MVKAMKLLNQYELDMILKSDKTDFNNFYKDELVQLLERARSELKHTEDQLDNALKMYDEEAKKNIKAIEYIQSTYVTDNPIKFKNTLYETLRGSDKE